MPEEDQEEVTLTRTELDALKKAQADSRQNKLELLALKADIDMDNPTAKLVFQHELPDDFTQDNVIELGKKYNLFNKSTDDGPDPNEKLGSTSGEEERISLKTKEAPDDPPDAPEKTSSEVAAEAWNKSIVDKGPTETLAEVLHTVMSHDAELERKAMANQAYNQRQQRREESS
jgi:hypothetical protein